jgi:hypothetical protein
MALCVGTVLLFWGGPDYHAARSTKALWNLGHIIYFAIATYLLLGWGPVAKLSPSWRWVIFLGFSFLVGSLIELLQYGIDIDADMGDVLRDVTGSVLVLSFGPGRKQILARSIQSGLQGIALLLLLIQLWPVASALTDEVIARRQFPLLSGFETPFEANRWEGDGRLSITSDPASGEGNVLRFELPPRIFSGLHLKHFNGDWRGFKRLRLRIYNPLAEPLRITCRIHDLAHETGNMEYHDRFNRRFLLEQGWNDLTIDLTEVATAPKTRRMDMAHIINLGLFTVALKNPRTLYLDDVRLTR